MSDAQVAAKTNTTTEATDTTLYAPARDSSRFVPLETISAILVSEDAFLGHGVVSNISESGACLITNAMIEPDRAIRVKFSTSQGTELFQTPARVVWSGEGMDRHSEIVGVLVGVTFKDSPDSHDKIAEVLRRDLFHKVGSPDQRDQVDQEETPVMEPAKQAALR